MAIALVLLGHFVPLWSSRVGFLGVELFFVLSGLLMAEILFLKKFELPEFFYRRLCRILPALWVFIGLSWIFLRNSDLSFGPLAALLAGSFLLNYGMVLTHPVGALDHLWSLCIEEHSYLLLGLLALLSRRDRKWVIGVTGTVSVLAMLNGIVSYNVLKQDYLDVYWRTDVHIASIFVATFFRLVLEGRSIPRWLSPCALGLGAALFLFTPASVGQTLGVSLLAIAVVALDHTYAALRNAFSVRPLAALGIASFSIYLWQQPFYKMATANPAMTPVFLPVVLVLGILSYKFIENPSRTVLYSLWPVLQNRRERIATL